MHITLNDNSALNFLTKFPQFFQRNGGFSTLCLNQIAYNLQRLPLQKHKGGIIQIICAKHSFQVVNRPRVVHGILWM